MTIRHYYRVCIIYSITYIYICRVNTWIIGLYNAYIYIIGIIESNIYVIQLLTVAYLNESLAQEYTLPCRSHLRRTAGLPPTAPFWNRTGTKVFRKFTFRLQKHDKHIKSIWKKPDLFFSPSCACPLASVFSAFPASASGC